MSKKKGLGRDINSSLEIMDELLSCLKKFHSMPLKRGLRSNNVDNGDLEKLINKSLEDSFALSVMIGDIKGLVSKSKPKANARFASQRVISKFLSIEDKD